MLAANTDNLSNIDNNVTKIVNDIPFGYLEK